MDFGMLAFAAAVAVGLTGLATAWAQSKIGPAMAGTIAERPEMVGIAIILIAIPETMVILGFAVAAIIMFVLPTLAMPVAH